MGNVSALNAIETAVMHEKYIKNPTKPTVGDTTHTSKRAIVLEPPYYDIPFIIGTWPYPF
jgi:hypothetical protein